MITAENPQKTRRILRSLGLGLLFYAAYYMAGSMGLVLAFVHPDFRVVWPPAGIAMAGILLLGYRYWPAIAAADFFIERTAGFPLMACFGVTAGNVLEALVGAFLLREVAGFRNSFYRVRDVVYFALFAALVSPIVSASATVLSSTLTRHHIQQNHLNLWLDLWLGDAMSILVITPVILSIYKMRNVQLDPRQGHPLRLLEGTLLVVAIVLSSLIVFTNTFQVQGLTFPFSFPLFPLIIWAAASFGPAGATLSVLYISGMALYGTATGVGPFRSDSFNEGLKLVQAYMIAVAGSAQMLAAAISERRSAESALRESEQRFRALSASSPMGIILTDADGNITYTNPTANRVFDTGEDSVGDSWQEHLHPHDETAVKEVWNKAIGEGSRFSADYRLVTPANQVKWIHGELAPMVSDKGQPTAFVGTVEDITFRKTAEQELRESRDELEDMQVKYRAILRSTPDGLCILSPQWRVVFYNEAMQEMFRTNLSSHGLTDHELSDVFPSAEQFQEYARSATKTMRTTGLDRREILLRRFSGETFWCEISLIRLNPAETFSGFVATLSDVTANKLAEQKLTALSEELRALSFRLVSAREEERTQIAREIHDELGQQLTGMRMMIYSLTGHAPANDTVFAEKVERISQLIDHTIATVRKISSELRPTVLDDLGLLEALQWLADDFAMKSGIPCRWASAVNELNLPKVISTAAFRIVQEALTNVARHAKATEVLIELACIEDAVRIAVHDDGVGFDASRASSTGSLGLIGMRERALLVGANILIQPRCNAEGQPETQRGTSVVLEIAADSSDTCPSPAAE